ncbi:RecB family exonuclease [Halalkalibacter oceani]|uniref:RecB family exonuclease n=1 Tax=Halalkalibacter oceani TaxID=1653776 RepID=UPI00339B31BD
MSERKRRVIPQRFKKKYGDKFPIWSFSKVNTLNNCVHSYYLERIEKVRQEDNIYSLCGTVVHDILEDFYNNRIDFKDMLPKFESDFLNIEISDFKFSSDQKKHDSMSDKYKKCISHFLRTHKKMAEKVATEKELWIDLNGHVFMGYVDAIHKDDEGNIIITDYKTSTKYSTKKVEENQNQLLLYAYGLHQAAGIPLHKIKCRWGFLKYVDISYKLKNGKTKTTTGERHKWVEKIKTPLKKDLIQFECLEDWQAQLRVEDLIEQNSLEGIHSEIADKYTLSDSYVEVDVNEQTISNMISDLTDLVKQILDKGKERENWSRGEIEKSEEYYCNVLCGVKKHCNYYKDYLNKNKEEEEVAEIDLNDLNELLGL